jgi:hypothetical protein
VDPRCAAALSLVREAGLNQSIARIRAVNATTPRRILLFTNVPVENLPVDRLGTYDEILSEIIGPNWDRLRAVEAAMDDGAGGVVAGLRLSAAGLHADAPHVWPTTAAAKSWRRGLTTPAVFDLIERTARARGVPRPQRLRITKPGGGRVAPAAVFNPGLGAIANVERLWPGHGVDGAWR